MSSVNRVILIGHLGQEPVARTTQEGELILTARLATNSEWVDKVTHEVRKSTEWHTLVFKGRELIEVAKQWRQGYRLWVQGSIYTHRYTSRGQQRRAVQIRVDQACVLSEAQGAHA